jgi:tight adherence protein C
MLVAVDGMGLLGAIGVGAVFALIVFTFASQADEKAVVRASLRQLEGYQVENQRDRELVNPLRERALLPALRGLTSLGHRFTPQGYVARDHRLRASRGKEPARGHPAGVDAAHPRP